MELRSANSNSSFKLGKMTRPRAMQEAQTINAQSEVTSLTVLLPKGDPVGLSSGGDQDLTSMPRGS